MAIQWYPGHMTSAMRMMQENIKLIDIVIEVLDARVPYSSKNPDIDKLAKGKFRLLILNKTDLADPNVTKKWKKYYEELGFGVIEMDARVRKNALSVSKKVVEICKEKIERDRKKGIIGRPIKAMIVGVPNVGKSTFINSFAGKASAKTGNKPGVTKGKQWIRVSKEMDLLDTPGVLWPKFEDQSVGEHLGFIGSISDEVLDKMELAYSLSTLMKKHYCNIMIDRYKITEDMSNERVIEQIADTRKCVLKGNLPDLEKAAKILLDDLRSGKLGRISIEFVEDYRKTEEE